MTRGQGAVLALALLSLLLPRSASAQGTDSTASRSVEFLPVGYLFTPLIADPKQPHFQISVLAADSPVLESEIGAIGLGETFGLVRWPGRRPGDGWQIDLAGAVFAQFELRSQATDLVNTDFLVGLPISYRRGRFSARLMLHHQSSHLGDEYLLSENPTHLNVTFDGIQLLLSRDIADWRVYAGGEHVFVHAPQPMKDGVFQVGVEYRRRTPLFRAGPREAARLVAALDVQSWQEPDVQLSWSARAGVELAPPDPTRQSMGRTWSLMLEAFSGPTPWGQFYTESISYVGLGLHFR